MIDESVTPRAGAMTSSNPQPKKLSTQWPSFFLYIRRLKSLLSGCPLCCAFLGEAMQCQVAWSFHIMRAGTALGPTASTSHLYGLVTNTDNIHIYRIDHADKLTGHDTSNAGRSEPPRGNLFQGSVSSTIADQNRYTRVPSRKPTGRRVPISPYNRREGS